MVSESRRKANDKWDAANMGYLSCKLRRADAERFRAWAADRGLTVNAALQAYVYACIGGKTLNGRETAPAPDPDTSSDSSAE